MRDLTDGDGEQLEFGNHITKSMLDRCDQLLLKTRQVNIPSLPYTETDKTSKTWKINKHHHKEKDLKKKISLQKVHNYKILSNFFIYLLFLVWFGFFV